MGSREVKCDILSQKRGFNVREGGFYTPGRGSRTREGVFSAAGMGSRMREVAPGVAGMGSRRRNSGPGGGGWEEHFLQRSSGGEHGEVVVIDFLRRWPEDAGADLVHDPSGAGFCGFQVVI